MDDAAVASFESQLYSINALPFLTAHSDAEGYFINTEHLAHLNPMLTAAPAQQLIDQATASTRTKTIEKMTNLRFDAENRNRKAGASPNPGATALQATSDYDAADLVERFPQPSDYALQTGGIEAILL